MSVVMDSPPWGDYVFLRAENFPRFKELARNFAKNAGEFRDKAMTGLQRQRLGRPALPSLFLLRGSLTLRNHTVTYNVTAWLQ